MNFKTILAALVMISTTSIAYAATSTYSDFTSWSDDISGIVTTDTYNGYNFTGGGANFVNYGSGTTLGGITYTTNNGDTLFGINKNWTADASYFRSNYLNWDYGSPNNSLTITLGSYTKAIGFNFGGYDGSPLTFSVHLSNGDSFTATGNSNSFAFLGAISDTAFNKVTISAPNYPGLDNLSLGPVVAVPEPETYGMMLVGVGLIGFMVRRRKNMQA